MVVWTLRTRAADRIEHVVDYGHGCSDVRWPSSTSSTASGLASRSWRFHQFDDVLAAVLRRGVGQEALPQNHRRSQQGDKRPEGNADGNSKQATEEAAATRKPSARRRKLEFEH
ncbi:hypothetical protein Q3C01_43865 [Bradyrhizobium sp. UFLA05-109]